VCDRLLRPYKEAFLASVDLKGVVLDVGTGAGVRLKYLALRPEITKIVCVEPNVLFREPLEKEIEAVKRRRVEMHPNAPHLAIEVKFATIEDYLEAEATAAKRSRNNDDSIDSCNRYFDAVTCFLVLCTIPDPKAAVATIHDRCLKPGYSLALSLSLSLSHSIQGHYFVLATVALLLEALKSSMISLHWLF
jgi:SAM-dependent methyltransferase